MRQRERERHELVRVWLTSQRARCTSIELGVHDERRDDRDLRQLSFKTPEGRLRRDLRLSWAINLDARQHHLSGTLIALTDVARQGALIF